jgi:DNA (cytosine-5)-methyltransferase 1
MRIGSLFSGIGGLDLGLERAGVGRTVWQVEADPFCRGVLARHWPDAVRYDDVREVRGGAVEPVDLLCGGFPCQDVSNAGKRAGLDGERSGLWYEFDRLVGELRPRFVVIENVAALLGRGGPDVLRSLAARGYDAWWDCVPASAVGAPHRRDRLFIVAWRVGDAERERLEGEHDSGAAARAALVAVRARNEWPTESGVGRVADGVSGGVDGLTFPTPRASDGRDKGRAGGKMPSLETVVMWPTPTHGDHDRGPGAPASRQGSPNLTDAVAMFPTPTRADGERSSLTYCRGNETLLGAVMWPTPAAGDEAGGRAMPPGTTGTGRTPDGRKVQVGLPNAVRMWPTPTAMLANESEDIASWEARREATRLRVGNGNGFGEPLGVAARRHVRPVQPWERDVPRTVTRSDRAANAIRKARLRALGNAVVPQVGEVIGRVVVALRDAMVSP